MYHPSKVRQRIEQEIIPTLGFEPVYRSVDEVSAFEDHLRESGKYVLDPQGLPLSCRNLDPWEVQWQLNERALVMADAMYALTRYCFVIDEEGVIRRFVPRVAQLILFGVISDLELDEVAIEILILKARQLGMTTIVELLIMLRIVFSYGVNSVIASADREKSLMMAKKLFMAYDMLPCWLRPQYTTRVESAQGAKFEFKHLNSGVTIQHGNQMSGIARGATPTIYHLCLSGKSLVRVSDSQVKSIRELTSGDRTISQSGELTRITAVSRSPRMNEITSDISVWGTPSALSCTRDHQVFTESGWKQAREVSSNDWLLYPVRPFTTDGSIHIAEFAKWKHRKNGVLQYEPTFELGRLVGLYLAKGCMYRGKAKNVLSVGYCIHIDEEERTQEWIRSVFETIQNRATWRRRNSKSAVVTVPHRGFAEWLSSEFGEKDDKRVSDLCWSLGPDFARGVVFGYLAGDGHYPPGSNEVYATGIRVAIPLGIRELIASLGYGWSQVSYREAGEWYNRNCRSCWVLVLAGETAVKLREAFDLPTIPSKRNQSPLHWHWATPNHIAIQVESVADGYSEDFWDIEVGDPGHAFLSVAGIVHNSEIGSFSNPEEQIEASLFRAVHASPSIFGILEGTGEGDDNWLAHTWRASKAKYDIHESRLLALFLPWCAGIDIYPKPAWLRAHPVPADFYSQRLPDTREHVAKVELYVSTHERIRKHLCAPHPHLPGKESWWTDGRMPLEQQWFWQVGHEEAKMKGMESTWFQEMAGDDMEALQRSAESVFGYEVMSRVNAERSSAVTVYGLCGQSIEDEYEPPPDDIDYSRPRLPVLFRSPRGDCYRWELIPLHHDESRVSSWKTANPDAFWDYAHGKLFVWHPPEPGFDYSVGIDTSKGIGSDSTVICVTRLAPRMGMQDVQAAEFRSAYVSHIQAYAFAIAIAAWYGATMESSGMMHHQPLLAPEQVDSVGDVVGTQMWKMGYRRFYRFTRFDGVPAKTTKANKLGWFTFAWARPIMLDTFIHSVSNGWYQLNSPWTIYECEHFEKHLTASGKVKQEHEEGEHDDGIFAAGISIIIARGKQAMTERSQKRFMGDPAAAALPALDLTSTPAGYRHWGVRGTPTDPTVERPPVDLSDFYSDSSMRRR